MGRDVVLGPMAPGALCLKRRVVIGDFSLVIHWHRPLHQDFAQLLLFSRVAKGIAPKARLRLECVSHRPWGINAQFTVDEGRKPLVLSGIDAPAYRN